MVVPNVRVIGLNRRIQKVDHIIYHRHRIYTIFNGPKLRTIYPNLGTNLWNMSQYIKKNLMLRFELILYLLDE